MQLDITFYMLLLSRYLKISGNFSWKFLFQKIFFSNGKFDFAYFYITVPQSDVVDGADYTEFTSGSTTWVLAECRYLQFWTAFFLIHLFFLISFLVGPRSYEGSYKITAVCQSVRSSVRPAFLLGMGHQLFLIFCTIVDNQNI